MPTRPWVHPRGPIRAARNLILAAVVWACAAPPTAEAVAPTILDFGARCDGKADDHPAFEAMLEKTGEIVVPAGRRCRLGSDLVIRSDRATVRCAPDGEIVLQGAFDEAGILIAGAQGVTIEDCPFDLAGRTAVPAIATDDLCSVAKGSCDGGAQTGAPRRARPAWSRRSARRADAWSPAGPPGVAGPEAPTDSDVPARRTARATAASANT
ncbi:MAG: hypothetical protein P8R42_10970 [Candidatus Binatia bacterium]|nr:hypothetical protein [Candidatus Binatia bacterium]